MRVIRVPPDRLDAFEEALLDRAGQAQEKSGEYERFRLLMGRWTVVGYDTGKVTISDAELMPVIEEVLDEVLDGVEETVVGSDEAGKGEWLGPLVVSACAVEPGDRAALVAAGVMDSKELSRERVLEAASWIEENQGYHSTVLVGPSRFNELFAEMKREGKGLNDLVAWAHANALGDVLPRIEGEVGGSVRVLVDEFDRVKTQARAARAFDVDRFPVEQEPGAEAEIAVAAASCLAKAARERWIDAFEEREGVPVRSLSMQDAREHAKRDGFAKTSYLED